MKGRSSCIRDCFSGCTELTHGLKLFQVSRSSASYQKLVKQHCSVEHFTIKCSTNGSLSYDASFYDDISEIENYTSK